MGRWTHPICERCWIEREGDRSPIRLNDPHRQTCCFCQKPTIFGVFVRAEPLPTCRHEEVAS